MPSNKSGLTEATTACGVVVLISGRGSNLKSLTQVAENYNVVGVISNRADAAGLSFAESIGIPTAVVAVKKDESRTDYDQRLLAVIDAWKPDLVCLAGFMRILSEQFVAHYADKLINIHPSLLPKYRGLHTHRRALEAGDTEHGASVHFVTAELDGGPVVAQIVIPIHPNDDESVLAARLLPHEHRLYPEVVNWYAVGRLHCENGQILFDGAPLTSPIRIHP